MADDATGPAGATIRPATRNDALHVAALVDMAGHGIELDDFIAARGADHSLLAVARETVLDPRNLSYHFSRAHLLEVGGEVAAGLVGGVVGTEIDQFNAEAPHIAPLLALENRIPGWWSIVAICVYPEFRGQGLALLLMRRAESLARAAGAPGLSLVVEDDNAAAIALYRRLGFVEAETMPWIAYGGRTGPREWVLMRKAF